MNVREQTRAELLDALAKLGRLRPDWRLGQALANAATTAGRLDAGGVWELEDEEALAAVRVLLTEYAETEPAEGRTNRCTRPAPPPGSPRGEALGGGPGG